MAQATGYRITISGECIARTPLHVGGGSDDTRTDLPLAVNGRGQLSIPGTSLAGALRGWCARAFGKPVTTCLWGGLMQGCDPQGRKTTTGHASHVVVEDAPVDLPPAAAQHDRGIVRDGVGIASDLGTAAERLKFDRAILPAGSRFPIVLQAELPTAGCAFQRVLLGHLCDALAEGRIRLGAAKTRGLGRVQLSGPLSIREQRLDTAEGILALLRLRLERPTAGLSVIGEPITSADLKEAAPDLRPRPQPRLEVEIDWHPLEPLMVKSQLVGLALDAVPLVEPWCEQVAMVLPGSAIKGVLRHQAERILATLAALLGRDLIAYVFGAAGQREAKTSASNEQRSTAGPLPGLGALAVDDCRSASAVPEAAWRDVVLATQAEDVPIRLKGTAWRDFAPAFHVAVDRWTGGAGDGLLFNVLEPAEIAWQPIEIGLDFCRLPAALRLPALALLVFVLRDLANGRLNLGYGANRGFGAFAVDAIRVNALDCDDAIDAELGNVVAQLAAQPITPDELRAPSGALRSALITLQEQWQRWLE